MLQSLNFCILSEYQGVKCELIMAGAATANIPLQKHLIFLRSLGLEELFLSQNRIFRLQIAITLNIALLPDNQVADNLLRKY